MTVVPYTQKQLDERRKCEILKYTKNSNQMTKKEQFAAAARGTLLPKRGFAMQTDTVTNSNVAGLQQIGNRLVCPSPVTRCSLTTDCNVPGAPIVLCYDPAVPLYNYVRTYEYKAGEVLRSRIPTTALSSPNDLILVGGDKQLTATWSPPDKDELGTYGGAAMAGYRIAYSTDRSTWTLISGTSTNPQRTPVAGLGKNDVYASTTCIITGLTNNGTYYVKIDSVNALNIMSAFPALSSTTTFMVPSKPLNVSAVGDTTSNTVNNVDKTSIIISWTVPFSNGGTPITGYAVEYSSDRHVWISKPAVLVDTDSAPQTGGLTYSATTGAYSYQFSGSEANIPTTRILTNSRYYVRMSAINLVVTDDHMPAPYSPIITVDTLTAPSAVANIYATAGSAKGQIIISWNEPTNTGGSPIQYYRVTYYAETDASKISILGGTTTQTSLTVSGLDIGIRYIFSVIAQNGVYESIVATVSARTNMAPGMPIGLKAAVVNGEIILSFLIDDDGGADIASYIVSLTTTSPDSANTIIWTPYEYVKTGAGSASTGRVVLNLMTAKLTSGITIPSTAIYTKLTYYFKVAATNALYFAVPGVSSPASSSVSATIIVAPAPPTNVSLIFDLTGNQIIWSAPTDTGGELASKIGYIIQYSSSQGEPKVWIWYNTVNNPITTTTITITTLRANTNYFFKIYAVNSIGMSVPTDVYNAATV